MPLDEKRGTDKPFSPFAIPSSDRDRLKFANDLIAICRASAPSRASYCRFLSTVAETGGSSGMRSLVNLMFGIIDRLASHLYSPVELRFTMDYENIPVKRDLDRAIKAARVLTRDFERNNTDIMFGMGVSEALKFGATLLKQWVQQEGADGQPVYYNKLVMPWQFGVYREDENDLSRQFAMCETTLLTMPEVWRRIHHLPDAERLYKKVEQHAGKGSASDEVNAFMHQIQMMSTGTFGDGSRPTPGGVADLSGSANYMNVGPSLDIPLARFHELWVWDRKDYTTFQVVEPDILVAPLYKSSNLLISGETYSGLHPYTLIQPNMVHGNIWGRSEITDLIELQGMLSNLSNDAMRLIGLQIDKIIAFNGYDTISDEIYGQFRTKGYITGPPGSSVADLTPKFPPELIPLIDKVISIIEKISGFDNILSGGGQPGVRAGVHADTLMKTASPRLRDRSLIVERQVAAAGDLRFHVMQAKDGKHYWTDANKIEETKFLLAELPHDWRVSVDSHSSSPIFADDHQNLIGFGIKSGFIGGKAAIRMLPYPDKDMLTQELEEKEAKQAAMLAQLKQENPELYAKVLAGGHGKGHR